MPFITDEERQDNRNLLYETFAECRSAYSRYLIEEQEKEIERLYEALTVGLPNDDLKARTLNQLSLNHEIAHRETLQKLDSFLKRYFAGVDGDTPNTLKALREMIADNETKSDEDED